MKIISVSSRCFPKCAFCKHWGDTENLHIRAISGGQQWKYNELAVCHCKLRGMDTRADDKCGEFAKKV